MSRLEGSALLSPVLPGANEAGLVITTSPHPCLALPEDDRLALDHHRRGRGERDLGGDRGAGPETEAGRPEVEQDAAREVIGGEHRSPTHFARLEGAGASTGIAGTALRGRPP